MTSKPTGAAALVENHDSNSTSPVFHSPSPPPPPAQNNGSGGRLHTGTPQQQQNNHHVYKSTAFVSNQHSSNVNAEGNSPKTSITSSPAMKSQPQRPSSSCVYNNSITSNDVVSHVQNLGEQQPLVGSPLSSSVTSVQYQRQSNNSNNNSNRETTAMLLLQQEQYEKTIAVLTATLLSTFAELKTLSKHVDCEKDRTSQVCATSLTLISDMKSQQQLQQNQIVLLQQQHRDLLQLQHHQQQQNLNSDRKLSLLDANHNLNGKSNNSNNNNNNSNNNNNNRAKNAGITFSSEFQPFGTTTPISSPNANSEALVFHNINPNVFSESGRLSASANHLHISAAAPEKGVTAAVARRRSRFDSVFDNLHTGEIAATEHAFEERAIDGSTLMVNQYAILEEIGAGAQAPVVLAHDTENNEFRAIKIIPRPIIDAKKLKSALMRETKRRLILMKREIAAMKRCRHKNLVALHEVIDDPESQNLFLVMEFMSRGVSACSHADGSADRRYTPRRIVHFGRRLTAALQYLHERGVVHRDIKPENILLRDDNEPCLADFGICSVMEQTSVLSPVTDNNGDSNSSPSTSLLATQKTSQANLAILSSNVRALSPATAYLNNTNLHSPSYGSYLMSPGNHNIGGGFGFGHISSSVSILGSPSLLAVVPHTSRRISLLISQQQMQRNIASGSAPGIEKEAATKIKQQTTPPVTPNKDLSSSAQINPNNNNSSISGHRHPQNTQQQQFQLSTSIVGVASSISALNLAAARSPLPSHIQVSLQKNAAAFEAVAKYNAAATPGATYNQLPPARETSYGNGSGGHRTPPKFNLSPTSNNNNNNDQQHPQNVCGDAASIKIQSPSMSNYHVVPKIDGENEAEGMIRHDDNHNNNNRNREESMSFSVRINANTSSSTSSHTNNNINNNNKDSDVNHSASIVANAHHAESCTNILNNYTSNYSNNNNDDAGEGSSQGSSQGKSLMLDGGHISHHSATMRGGGGIEGESTTLLSNSNVPPACVSALVTPANLHAQEQLIRDKNNNNHNNNPFTTVNNNNREYSSQKKQCGNDEISSTSLSPVGAVLLQHQKQQQQSHGVGGSDNSLKRQHPSTSSMNNHDNNNVKSPLINNNPVTHDTSMAHSDQQQHQQSNANNNNKDAKSGDEKHRRNSIQFGTAAYAAPECTSHKYYEDKLASDVWSLGLTLYTLLYGCLPWPVTPVYEYFQKIETEDIPFPPQWYNNNNNNNCNTGKVSRQAVGSDVSTSSSNAKNNSNGNRYSKKQRGTDKTAEVSDLSLENNNNNDNNNQKSCKNGNNDTMQSPSFGVGAIGVGETVSASGTPTSVSIKDNKPRGLNDNMNQNNDRESSFSTSFNNLNNHHNNNNNNNSCGNNTCYNYPRPQLAEMDDADEETRFEYPDEDEPMKELVDLLKKMLVRDPMDRISIQQARKQFKKLAEKLDDDRRKARLVRIRQQQLEQDKMMMLQNPNLNINIGVVNSNTTSEANSKRVSYSLTFGNHNNQLNGIHSSTNNDDESAASNNNNNNNGIINQNNDNKNNNQIHDDFMNDSQQPRSDSHFQEHDEQNNNNESIIGCESVNNGHHHHHHHHHKNLGFEMKMSSSSNTSVASMSGVIGEMASSVTTQYYDEERPRGQKNNHNNFNHDDDDDDDGDHEDHEHDEIDDDVFTARRTSLGIQTGKMMIPK